MEADVQQQQPLPQPSVLPATVLPKKPNLLPKVPKLLNFASATTLALKVLKKLWILEKWQQLLELPKQLQKSF